MPYIGDYPAFDGWQSFPYSPNGRRVSYCFSPIKIWIASALVLWVLNPASLASMPTSFKTDISAFAAGSNCARWDGCKCISTFCAATGPDRGRSPRLSLGMPSAAAQPHSQVPQDDDALSNWSSLAFIVPFGNRHAGKEFRGFWIGLGLATFLFSLVFAASYLWG